MTVQEMFEHIERSREQILKAASKLDRESFLSRKKGMSSIRDLLVHLMDTEDYWVGSVILGQKRQKFMPDRYEDAAALKRDWVSIHERTRKLIRSLSEPLLAEKRTVRWEDEITFDVDTALWHLLAHELHHSGQICLLMREKGYEPPVVDIL